MPTRQQTDPLELVGGAVEIQRGGDAGPDRAFLHGFDAEGGNISVDCARHDGSPGGADARPQHLLESNRRPACILDVEAGGSGVHRHLEGGDGEKCLGIEVGRDGFFRRQQAIDPHRPAHVLEAFFADIGETALPRLAEGRVDRLRNADASRFRQPLDPLRDVDAVPVDIVVVDDDVAEVNADPELEAAPAGSPRGGNGRLYALGGRHRARHCREFGQDGVAGVIYGRPAVMGESTSE